MFKSKLNKILHDKNDYHLDLELKKDIEISEEILQVAIKYQKNIIIRKIRYLFQNNKYFFVRLFVKLFLKFAIFIGVILTVLFLIFGFNVNLKKVEKSNENYEKYPIYIISSGDIRNDSILIADYKRILKNEDLNYIIIYPKNNSKDYNKWKSDLHGIESNGWDNPYEARREGSQYWGKYQLGESARRTIGLSNISWDQWKNNPELQEAALKLWIDVLYKDLEDEIRIYDGKFLNGWSITESGIIAMAHNVGSLPVKEFLNSGGKNIPKDGSGKDVTRFLILGNYDLNLKK